MAENRGKHLWEIAFGGGVTALGLFIVYETMNSQTYGNAVVGPALFPYLIATGLILIGAVLVWQALRHPGSGQELDGIAIAVISAGLLVQMLLLETLGWIVSSTILFVTVSYAFGNRSLIRSGIIGLALACLTFAVFNYGLDLTLPGGSLWENVTTE